MTKRRMTHLFSNGDLPPKSSQYGTCRPTYEDSNRSFTSLLALGASMRFTLFFCWQAQQRSQGANA